MSFRDLMGDLLRLIDDLTAYFQESHRSIASAGTARICGRWQTFGNLHLHGISLVAQDLILQNVVRN